MEDENKAREEKVIERELRAEWDIKQWETQDGKKRGRDEILRLGEKAERDQELPWEDKERHQELFPERSDQAVAASPASDSESCSSNDDDDDQTSVFSSGSIPNARSLSNFASDGKSGLPDVLEELASLFLYDGKLSGLLKVALRRNNVRIKFVSKFRQLLMIYGRELRQEAINGTQEIVAELVQAKTNYVVTRIQWMRMDESNHYGKLVELEATGRAKSRKERQIATPSESYGPIWTLPSWGYDEGEDDDQSDISSVAEEFDVNLDAPYISLKALAGFMTSSIAFDRLRKAFGRMRFPNPLRRVQYIVSNASESSFGACMATFNVHWPALAYIATELGYEWSMEHKYRVLNSVLTISCVHREHMLILQKLMFDGNGLNPRSEWLKWLAI